MNDFRNNNGLIAGLIPAGSTCPFLDRCKFRVHNCPTAEKPKANNFSCAAARAFSIITEAEAEEAGSADRLKRIVQKEVNFILPKRNSRLSFSGMNAVKEEGKEES